MSDKYPELKAMVRGCYDLQQLRMQAGLRLCANFRSKLGILGLSDKETDDDADDPSLDMREEEPEGEDESAAAAKKIAEKEAKKIMKLLKASYDKITEGVAKGRELPTEKGFKGDPLISTYAELVLIYQYFALYREEQKQFRMLDKFLADIPIWATYLKDVPGVGPAMGGIIITEFDIHKARYPSSLWRYAGLDVDNTDHLGRSRRENHLIDHKYIDKNGEEKVRRGLSYNPFLKTKLMGVLAGSFLRLRSPWADVYYNYKNRIESDPNREKVTVAEFKRRHKAGEPVLATTWRPGRINDASKRYMVKIFLIELYNKWRRLEGLEVAPTYDQWKHGHKHRGRDAA